MELLHQLNASGMQIVAGRIIDIGKDGKLQVKADNTGAKITCDFLRTSAGPLPQLYLGTPVLCIVHEHKGYVLGVVQPYVSAQDERPEQNQAPQELNLRAEQSIELTCGQSSLSMDKEGKIVLRGADITTRAHGANKIKGASVRLN
jgi:hypothetical protein